LKRLTIVLNPQNWGVPRTIKEIVHYFFQRIILIPHKIFRSQ